MIKKATAACLIAVIFLALAGCGAIKGKATSEKKHFVPADNMKVVDTQVKDLDGDGKKEKVALYVVANEQSMPVWKLVVDEYEMATLDSQDGTYTLADFNLQELDGENGLEILCYRYNIKSDGGLKMIAYKYTKNDWLKLFDTTNTLDNGKDRFNTNYLGNYKVSFEDQKIGLKNTIELDESLYKGKEELLESIDTWVSPVSEYRFTDENNDGTSEITSMQRVTGISHMDTIATLQTTYHLDKEYQPTKVALVDIKGRVLAEKNV